MRRTVPTLTGISRTHETTRRLGLLLLLWLVAASGFTLAQTRVRFNVNTGNGRKPISPLVYGTNDHYPHAAAKRLGGNRITNYNWENNASNAGFDWYHNSDNYVPWQQGVPDAEYDTPGAALKYFQQRSLDQQAYSLVTLPMAKYVTKDKNGAVTPEQAAPSSRWASIHYRKPSPFTLQPDPADTAVYVDEQIHFLLNQFGRSNTARGVKGYALDNEPGLWFHTHSRLWGPGHVSVKYLMDHSIALARRIKEMDPTAEVFGPAAWGVTEFENLQFAPDWDQQKGSYPTFLDLYLGRMREYEQQTGTRLLDVLDVHWYPQNNNDGVSPMSTSLDRATNAARLAMTRSLWDPSYIENTWIGNDPFKVQQFLPFLPKMKQHIDQYYPGTKLAITEYSYMGGGHAAGGIAQADALGIFGRYGVYLATYWGGVTDYIKAGFDLYRNYDGQGGRFGDTAVEATTDNTGTTSVYSAIHGSDDSKLHLIALNKSQDGPVTATFTVSGNRSYKSARVWGFDNSGTALKPLPNVRKIDNNTFEYTIPTLTACHFVLSQEDLAVQPYIADLKISSDVGYSDGTATFTVTARVEDSNNDLQTVTADFSALGGGNAVALQKSAADPNLYQVEYKVPAGASSGLKSIRVTARDAAGDQAESSVTYRIITRTATALIWDGDDLRKGVGEPFYDPGDTKAALIKIQRSETGGHEKPGSMFMHFEHDLNHYNTMTWRWADNNNPADARDLSDYGALEFFLKTNAPDNSDIEVSLRDATAALTVSTSVFLKQGGYLGSIRTNGYTRVKIPLSAFKSGSEINLSQIWQINFTCNTAPKGFDAWVDDIRVLPYSNPVVQPVFRQTTATPASGYANGSTTVRITAEVTDPDNNLSNVVADLSPLGGSNRFPMTKENGLYVATLTLPNGLFPGEKQINLSATDADGNQGDGKVRFTVNAQASTTVLWDGDVVNTGKAETLNQVTTCVVSEDGGHNAPKSMKMHFDMADNGFAAAVWDWNENTGDERILDLSTKGYLSFFIKVNNPGAAFDVQVFLKDRFSASTSPVSVRAGGYLSTFSAEYQQVRIPMSVLYGGDPIDRKQVTRIGFLSTGLDRPYDFQVDDITAGGSNVANVNLRLQNAQCGRSGVIEVRSIGGSEHLGEYRFLLNNAVNPAGEHNPVFSELKAGTYELRIEGPGDFRYLETITLTELNTGDKPQIKAAVTVENGKGFINTEVTGGSGFYQFKWSEGSETQHLWGVSAGTYSLTVTDGVSGCSSTATFTVVIPEIELRTETPSCAPNGKIIVTKVSGLTNPRFLLDGKPNPAGAQSPEFRNLVPGRYVVRVEGDGGAAIEREVELEGSGSAPVVAADISYNSGKGYVNLNVTGGSGIYTYEWSTGATTLNIWEVPPGTYSVVVTDLVSQCKTTFTATVDADDESIMMYPNPAVGQESVWIKFNFAGYAIQRMTVTDHLGQVVYSTAVPEGATELTLPVRGWKSGKYQVAMEGKKVISKHLIIQ
ncbi:glycoside hydrolase family 44 protein [Larkinella soli]|uniref:glycoside hydrolase family 44 protein n=1 Tax=Larkinella soli TaxID=1770527 RepID=UPI000FFCA55D|nr:glycoside hydrolase family 44 protein [Larkinella soli]